MLVNRRFARWCTGLLLAAAPAAGERALRVAAASDLETAMPEIVAAFGRSSGVRVEVVYGSSGNFVAQVRNGAPLDVFFSADRAYAEKLARAGLAGKVRSYALGKIVLWVPASSRLEPGRDGWAVLRDPGVARIAVANPAHAPYGRAAVEALRGAGLYEAVEAKLVYGDNISQAVQFVESGNAQAGIVAYALTFSPALRGGKSWEVPARLYAPIEQSVVVLKRGRDNPAAEELVTFVTEGPGRQLLAKYGFAPPEKGPQ